MNYRKEYGNDQLLFLEKNWIKSMDVSELLTYISLKIIVRQNRSREYINYQRLCFECNLEYDISIKRIFQKGIKSLSEKKLIKIEREGDKSNEFIINTEKLNYNHQGSKEPFVVIRTDEVFHILSGIKTRRLSYNIHLLRYFIFLIGTFYNDEKLCQVPMLEARTKVGAMIMKDLSNMYNISESSIISYNKILEEEQLIYIERNGNHIINGEGKICQVRNVYSRPEDKEECKLFMERLVEHYNRRNILLPSKLTKKEQNESNHYSLLYRSIKHGNSYSEEELNETIEWANIYNNALINKMKELSIRREEEVTDEIDKWLKNEIRKRNRKLIDIDYLLGLKNKNRENNTNEWGTYFELSHSFVETL